MRVVELGDSSIVVEKGPEDREEFTIGSMFEDKTDPKVMIFVPSTSLMTYRINDYIYTEDTLIVYFKDSIPPEFELNARVGLKVGWEWYEADYENSRTR